MYGSMGLLGDILTVLNKVWSSHCLLLNHQSTLISLITQGWREEDFRVVYSILTKLARTSRFGLSVDFLSKQEKQAVSEYY